MGYTNLHQSYDDFNYCIESNSNTLCQWKDCEQQHKLFVGMKNVVFVCSISGDVLTLRCNYMFCYGNASRMSIKAGFIQARAG